MQVGCCVENLQNLLCVDGSAVACKRAGEVKEACKRVL